MFVYVKFISPPPHSSAPFFNLQPSSRHYQRISTSLFVDVHIPGLGHRTCGSCPHHIISQCFDMDFNLLRLFSLSLSLPLPLQFSLHFILLLLPKLWPCTMMHTALTHTARMPPVLPTIFAIILTATLTSSPKTTLSASQTFQESKHRNPRQYSCHVNEHTLLLVYAAKLRRVAVHPQLCGVKT